MRGINKLTRECLDLYLQGKKNKEIAEIINERYGASYISSQIHDRIKNCREYRAYNQAQRGETEPDDVPGKRSFEYKANGDCISERIIEISKLENITPESMMKKHGLVPHLWEVVAYRNNFWQNQVKGGGRLTLYQSRLTVKPRKQGLSLEEIDKHFQKLDRTYKPLEILPATQPGNLMAEVNIADLHFGRLCWYGDTGNNFDYKIARRIYQQIISDVCHELEGKPLEYILFPIGNDLVNSDTVDKKTTAGTPQDTDQRWQKLTNIATEMVIAGIDMLKVIAPVKAFYVASNHDEQTTYGIVNTVKAWFRNDARVEVDRSAMSRKYCLYGNTLIGFSHGNNEKPMKGTSSKLSGLAGNMPVEAPKMWAKSKYREFHAAHLHCESAIEEINGVIARRISSPTARDTWTYESGYVGAVRKAQTFIYDKEMGLANIINTPIKETEI